MRFEKNTPATFYILQYCSQVKWLGCFFGGCFLQKIQINFVCFCGSFVESPRHLTFTLTLTLTLPLTLTLTFFVSHATVSAAVLKTWLRCFSQISHFCISGGGFLQKIRFCFIAQLLLTCYLLPVLLQRFHLSSTFCFE